MPPKKKGKEKPPKVDLKASSGPPPKPKKIPPPPASFTPEDIQRFKDMFKEHDEDGIDKIPLTLIPHMLRRLGFNPKPAEIRQMFAQFLEDDLVDTVELHEWYFMVEAKISWGDDFEQAVIESMKNLGHDEGEDKTVNLHILMEELTNWGDALTEIEFVDWIRLATREKCLQVESGDFLYEKFVDMINQKDAQNKFIKEPVNFFKLDQKTLAAMAIQKAQEEKEENERKEAEKKAREEAKRLRMIADGLLPPD